MWLRGLNPNSERARIEKGIPHGVQRGSGLITEGVRGDLHAPNRALLRSLFSFDFFVFLFYPFPLLFLFLFRISSLCLGPFFVRRTHFCFFPPCRIDVPALCAGLHARIIGLISIVGKGSGKKNAESDESQSNFHEMGGKFKSTCLQGYK